MRNVLIASMLTAMAAIGITIHILRQERHVEAPEPPSAQTSPPLAPIMIPQPDQVIAQLNRPLSREQQQEDAGIDEDQVRKAEQWLNKPDAKDRLAGVEQLGAYPTSEAEALLVTMLNTDVDAEVRSAAAQNLDSFEKLGKRTIDALIQALEDDNANVRASALSTLEDQVAKENDDSTRYKTIIARLKKMAASRQVNKETRDAIREFLREQAS